MATVTSNEPARSSAYSEDLRWKIIWQRLALELPTKVVAKNLCIDGSTVRRTCEAFNNTGAVSKKAYPVERASKRD